MSLAGMRKARRARRLDRWVRKVVDGPRMIWEHGDGEPPDCSSWPGDRPGPGCLQHSPSVSCWTCSRVRDHEGPHVARTYPDAEQDSVCAVWS